MLRAMKKTTLAAALLFAACTVAPAAEVSGVNVPDTATVDGKALKLNGAGLRKKAIFKVYVAGLYVENPTHDAAALLSSNQVKSMRLRMMRSVKGKQIAESIQEGFDRNSKAQQDKLKDRLGKFTAMIPDVEEGDEIAMTWVPDHGTRVSVRGTDRGTIEGRDFADALFAVWLGPDPVQEDLKKALAGS
jgi:hypothetical protein